MRLVLRGVVSISRRPVLPVVARCASSSRTSVEVDKITLAKPKKPGSWPGLAGLEQRVAGSLVEETLRGMAGDDVFQTTAKQLREVGAVKMTLDEKKRRRRALADRGAPDFVDFVKAKAALPSRTRTSVLQLNVGLYCNQACNHCHVESSPERKEVMTAAVAQRCLEVLRASPSVKTLDLTGGAPELNSEFRFLVEEARRLDPLLEIIDRCNLTVLAEPGQEDLAAFLAAHDVRVVASLPCYSAKNVNLQRGRGVFDRSIAGLRQLNAVGYGTRGGRRLDLVYNPLGAFLPPAQEALEAKYREELRDNFAIEFTHLFTMTNMPIKRFADFLHRRGELEDYMSLLVQAFNPHTLTSLMCRDTLSVRYDGAVFDCDFNQQLGLHPRRRQGESGEMMTRNPCSDDEAAARPRTTIFDMASTDDFLAVPVAFDNHCYGCTAGAGSS